MRMMSRLAAVALLLTAGILIPCSPVLADSIVPAAFSATLGVGATATLDKTVTITRDVTAPVDVMFLSDTTGSMGGAIASVKTGVGSIISAVAPLSSDTAFAVGEYRDRFDGFQYRLNQGLTSDAAAVQAGVNGWAAGGGADTPESNLYALSQAANTLGWRAGSTRMLFWIGDSPGHDPGGPIGDTATEAQATAALLSNFIRTYGINVGAAGLDQGPAWGGCSSTEGGCDFTAGQATRITTATGGYVISGDYDEVADIIIAAITTGLTNYHTVELIASGLGPGLDVTLSPGYVGDWTRDADRPFGFTVGFRGVTAGTYDFDIVAVLDGAAVAYEHDHIVVGAVPEPSSLLLLGTGLVGVGRAWRKRRG